jgi:hypothetical protein
MRDLVLFGRLGKFTWRMCALVLAAQSVIVFFGALVAWGIASADRQGPAAAYLWLGTGLALLCLVAAGLMRTAYGVTLGWLIQLATLAGALVVPLMLLVAVIFGGLWTTSLVQGGRIDRAQAARAAQAGEGGHDQPSPTES